MTILSSRVVKANRLAMGQEAHRILPKLGPNQPDIDVAVSERVDHMIERSRQEALAILEEAQEEARRLTQNAREQGYQEGMQQGLAQSRGQWQTILSQMAAPLVSLDKLGHFTETLQQEEMLSLAGALLVRCFPLLAERDPEVFQSYLKAALAELNEESARIFVSPKWEPYVKAVASETRAGIQEIRLSVDQMLGEDEWRLETDRGGILAGPLTTLSTVINEVINGLGEHPFADR